MRNQALSLAMGVALAACLAIGVTGSAGAATLDFTGTLSLQMPVRDRALLVVPAGGSAQVTDDGAFHLLSLLLPGGAFGPITTSLPLTSNPEFNSVIFTGMENLLGTFTPGGGPAGGFGGRMGLSGTSKICTGFTICAYANVTIPLTPTTGGAVGFGIGGTQTVPRVGVDVTMRHAPWTIGQPVITFHTPGSTITTPVLPGGFAHGPASLTSSTAQPSGVLQLATASRVITSIGPDWPPYPLTGVLTLQFVPEPSTLLLVGFGAAALAAAGRRRKRGRGSRQ